MRDRMLFIALSLTFTGLLSAQNCKQILGSWRELPNEASAFRFKIEPEPPGLKFSDCKPDGTCGEHTFSFNYDGKKHKVPPDFGTYFSYRKITDHTVEEKDWVGDGSKLRETDTWTIAPDGKTLTVESHYQPSPTMKANQKPIVQFFNRRGDSPKAQDDPFVGFWVQDLAKSTPRVEGFLAKGDDIEATTSGGFDAVVRCDGKDHPLEGQGDFETLNLRQEGDSIILEYKKQGKTTVKYINQFSADGKTRHVVGRSPEGKEVAKLTFERVE